MRFRWLRAILGFVVVGGLAFPLLCMIAIALVPNRTSDGHPVMPIGQVAFGLFGAPILGIVAGWLVGRVRKRALD